MARQNGNPTKSAETDTPETGADLHMSGISRAPADGVTPDLSDAGPSAEVSGPDVGPGRRATDQPVSPPRKAL
ncbi:MAG: hypothetical protein AAFY05_19645 [Pseudomonadota bacterium]